MSRGCDRVVRSVPLECFQHRTAEQFVGVLVPLHSWKIPVGASGTVNNAQFELVEVIQLGPGTRLQRTVQQTGIVMVVATVCFTQFRSWCGSTSVAGCST